MPKQLILVFALLFKTSASDAQIVTKVYHGDNWICHRFYTTFEDYILELFNNSTIQLSVYRSTSENIKLPSAITFSGIYSLSRDTMKISYLNQNTTFENSFQQDSTSIKKNIPSLFLPCTFISTDSTIKSTENAIPLLHISSISKAIKLKNDFSKRKQQIYPRMSNDSRFKQID